MGYARWMLEYHSKRMDLNDDDIVFFIKDNLAEIDLYKYRSLEEVLYIASLTGFGCRQIVTGPNAFSFGDYASLEEMKRFTINEYLIDREKSHGYKNDNNGFKSKYNNMSEWLSDLDIDLPSITRICFGGIFAAKVSNILSVPEEVLISMEQSLSRDNNIEEGHFAERVWAGLLAKNGTKEELDYFRIFYGNRIRDKGIDYALLFPDTYGKTFGNLGRNKRALYGSYNENHRVYRRRPHDFQLFLILLIIFFLNCMYCVCCCR